MPARLKPWVGAAAVASVLYAATQAMLLQLPATFGAVARLDISQGARKTSGAPEWPTLRQFNDLRNGLERSFDTVQLSLETGGDKRSVVARAQGINAEVTRQTANAAIQQAQAAWVTCLDRPAFKKHRESLSELHHARAERSRAARALDRLLKARPRPSQEAPPTHAAAAPPAPMETPLPSVDRRNPLWDDLARQVAELEGRRAGLLQTMTPAHPVVRDLEWQLAQLRRQWSATTEFTQAPAPDLVGPLPRVARTPAPAQTPTPPANDSGDLELEAQRALLAEAESAIVRAIDRERAAWQTLLTVRSESQSALRCMTAVTRPHDSVARTAISSGGPVVALLAAALTMWRMWPRRRTLRTVEQARRVLPVPVIGKLSIASR